MSNIGADLTNQPIVWRPRSAIAEHSRAMRFAAAHGLTNHDELARQAVDDPAWFWGAVSEELGLVWSRPFNQVLDLSDGKAWPHWYVDGRMNYVASAVDRHLAERAEEVAISWEGDDGSTRSVTFEELAEQVNRTANGLRSVGVNRGTRVGIYMPMLIETAVAVLACGKLGAIIVPIFSGFGADAASTRLSDAKRHPSDHLRRLPATRSHHRTKARRRRSRRTCR